MEQAESAKKGMLDELKQTTAEHGRVLDSSKQQIGIYLTNAENALEMSTNDVAAKNRDLASLNQDMSKWYTEAAGNRSNWEGAMENRISEDQSAYDVYVSDVQ